MSATPSWPDTEWLDRGWPHVWLPYTQMQGADLPLPAVATQGTRISLADGRQLIDGIASWWTACHGYNHPHIVAAIHHQLDRMAHVMFGGLGHQPAFDLARRLAAMLPGDLNRVFFADSGSVAVEIAIKMALQYWINMGQPERRRILCFNGGYHGDTTGAMSVTDPKEGMHALFSGLLPEHYFADIPADDAGFAEFEDFLDQKQGDIAAVLIEPLVQGAGGMRFHGPEILGRIHGAAKKHGLLFITDEIFTGFGRTGAMFACDSAGITPDIMCLGKALTGGALSLAATVATDAVYDAFLSDRTRNALMHGPTFMANPLACAAANASLDLFEGENRVAEAGAIEARLAETLAPCRELTSVADVRALGAIGVVELEKISDLAWFRRRFIERGVWLRPFGNIVYLTPALTIGDSDLATLTDSINMVVAEWSEL
ncbi:MAG: adenosylmethionine--8-amino-7-oxononanoate transaminase [Rhodospirillales bacterium]|nr:adenosylmethionine--8-amino-7-oxononanoate transaminase [Rhodospirillales bacterium]